MRVMVLTNPAAGAKADEASELRDVLAQANVQAEARAMKGDQLTDAAREAAKEKIDAVVAAGGDGTVSAVAAALVDRDMPLGILPTGTLNHFAKDLQIPTTLPAAARIIAHGAARRVDVGSISGRPFINNSSIGIYPHIVGEREEQRQRLGRGKWMAMLVACVSTFRRHPTVRVTIGVGDQRISRDTPFVFVGNNRYQMSMTTLGSRTHLDRGELSLYFAHRSGRFALLTMAIRAMLGMLEQSKDFESLTTPRVTIDTRKRSLRVALDGEVIRLSPPLHYEVKPAALLVLSPGENRSWLNEVPGAAEQ